MKKVIIFNQSLNIIGEVEVKSLEALKASVKIFGETKPEDITERTTLVKVLNKNLRAFKALLKGLEEGKRWVVSIDGKEAGRFLDRVEAELFAIDNTNLIRGEFSIELM